MGLIHNVNINKKGFKWIVIKPIIRTITMEKLMITAQHNRKIIDDHMVKLVVQGEFS